MHRFEMSTVEGLDRERYLRAMSDRLHDRFLERPAFLDIDFIRAEIKKLDAQIDTSIANHQSWPTIVAKLGDPVEYADAVYASRLLSPEVAGKARKSSVVMTVLKVLFVVAPVNFLVAIGPLLISLLLVLVGWIFALGVFGVPLALIIHLIGGTSAGASENLLLAALASVGVMALLAMVLVSRVVIWGIWTWLGWNVAFLRAEPRR